MRKMWRRTIWLGVLMPVVPASLSACVLALQPTEKEDEAPETREEENWKYGEERTATVGSQMIEWAQLSRTGRKSKLWKGVSHELRYAGISGSTIRLTYREFNVEEIELEGGGYRESLARPAFSQELTYDISLDSRISYDRYALEVIKADSNRISFRVVDAGANGSDHPRQDQQAEELGSDRE